jgi:hypothetical protein
MLRVTGRVTWPAVVLLGPWELRQWLGSELAWVASRVTGSVTALGCHLRMLDTLKGYLKVVRVAHAGLGLAREREEREGGTETDKEGGVREGSVRGKWAGERSRGATDRGDVGGGDLLVEQQRDREVD